MAEGSGNKFGLLDAEDEPQTGASLADKLAAFPVVKPRAAVDFAAMDAAAASHGFVSREAIPLKETRRRRAIPAEPTRHLAIRLTSSAYDRFVAYADRHKLTYHEALIQLMDSCQDG
jgi:hypothetical protein